MKFWDDLRMRWECLKEALNGSYSRQYRVFRLKEALGYDPEKPSGSVKECGFFGS